MLSFLLTNTTGNAGSGTIKRAGEEMIISIKPKRVADPRCVVLSGEYPAAVRVEKAVALECLDQTIGRKRPTTFWSRPVIWPNEQTSTVSIRVGKQFFPLSTTSVS
jgi:hypothetical protein